MTKSEIKQLQNKVRARLERRGVDLYDDLESIVIDSFGVLSWEDTLPFVVELALEDCSPSVWQAMSNMFYAFVGMSLREALENLEEYDDEKAVKAAG